MSSERATYSTIIGPDDYCRIMTEQHLHIAHSDRKVMGSVLKWMPPNTRKVVELGCGPGRLLEQVQARLKSHPHIQLIGIDHDEQFLERARRIADETRTRIIQTDLAGLGDHLKEKVPVIYSQGVHHHISKGDPLNAYLGQVHEHLTEDGIYVLSDEFLPEYQDASDRLSKAVIWYSYIINDAQQKGYDYLAQEEAKTLIDDLNEGREADLIKTPAQIQLVLDYVGGIAMAALRSEAEEAQALATQLLSKLEELKNYQRSGDHTVDLSRGDFKVSPSIFMDEVEGAGFTIEDHDYVGPVDTIGGMRIYTLRKAV